MRLAVIPARGGSKRIPRKNIKLFAGKPMIAWSIEAARASGLFDRILITTDDEEIANVATVFGAEVPFIRPAELADDYTPTIPVIAHAVQWQVEHGVMPAQVCCIYATAPFIEVADIRQGLRLLEQTACDYAFSVTSYAYPIQRALRVTPGARMAMFSPEHFLTRSQDLEPAYHDAAQFYWGNAAAWLARKPFFGENSSPVLLPRHRVQDIDTPDDWERAELMYRALRLCEKRE
jgi:N-acylneuraminate cytidylyltransferase